MEFLSCSILWMYSCLIFLGIRLIVQRFWVMSSFWVVSSSLKSLVSFGVFSLMSTNKSLWAWLLWCVFMYWCISLRSFSVNM